MIDASRTILTFTAENHIYRREGRIVPSVTQALAEAKIIDYSGIPRDVLEAAASRGRLVHRVAEWVVTEHSEGAVDPDSIDPAAQPYIDSLRRWIDATGFIAHHVECRVWHPQWNYAGTFDACGKDRYGDELLPDWKTGQPSEAHEIQAEAYVHATGEPRRWRSPVVYLQADGSMAKVRPPKGDKFAVFTSAVNCLNYRIGKGTWPIK